MSHPALKSQRKNNSSTFNHCSLFAHIVFQAIEVPAFRRQGNKPALHSSYNLDSSTKTSKFVPVI